MFSVRQVLWPSPELWQSILRGVASQLGRGSEHTIICVMTQRASKQRRVPYDAAREYVHERIVAQVWLLALELGLAQEHARAICQKVDHWLWSVANGDGAEQAYWPSREEWLAIDRAAAGHAFLDSNTTLSANLAWIVAQRDRITPARAIRRVHAAIARHASQLARECGFDFFDALGIQLRLSAALNSFDRT